MTDADLVLKDDRIPDVHHVWCNGLGRDPVVGCRWCNPKPGKGLWIDYPYDPATGPEEGFTEKHFPDVVERK